MPNLQPETIERVAAELVGIQLSAEQQRQVAELLRALAPDMHAMQKMDVDVQEPAHLFDPFDR